MTLINDSQSTHLNYATLDEDHAQFIQLVNQLETANSADFPKLFAQLHEHTEHHFDKENKLMDEYGFPAITEHKGEHGRILADFKQFRKRVDRGLIPFGRAFVKDQLPQWFQLHVSTMDSALVAHINKQN